MESHRHSSRRECNVGKLELNPVDCRAKAKVPVCRLRNILRRLPYFSGLWLYLSREILGTSTQQCAVAEEQLITSKRKERRKQQPRQRGDQDLEKMDQWKRPPERKTATSRP